VRKKAAALIAVLVILSVPQFLEAAPEAKNALSKTREERDIWLFLIYMAGDNNLGENGSYGNAAWMDLEELENAIPNDGAQVLVLSDMKGDHNTVLYDIVPHPEEGLGSVKVPLETVNPHWSDELDMSDWRVLRDFLIYSIGNHSAENTMLTIWDHGSGWTRMDATSPSPATRGFAIDGSGSMRLDGLRNALQGASDALSGDVHFDIISFDTCSMGMVEVFYQVSPFADIAVGSQDEQPWYGYNYEFVSMMNSTEPARPVEIAAAMIEGFKETYPNEGYGTIVSVDLGIMTSGVVPSFDALSRELLERMYHLQKDEPELFRSVGSRSERMRTYTSCDLGNLLEELIFADLDPVITSLANDTLNIYQDSILSEYHSTVENPAATGLSLYFPLYSGIYNSLYDGSSGFLNFTAENRWDEVLREYFSPVQRVAVNCSVISRDQDGTLNDLDIIVLHPPSGGTPIPDAQVFIDDQYQGITGGDGYIAVDDVETGVHTVTAYNGSHVGYLRIKVLNRAPVAKCSPLVSNVSTGRSVTLYAVGSYDPDGDELTFQWDVNDTDGLDDVDHTGPTVTVSYIDVGPHGIRLRVSDGLESSRVDAVVNVINNPPSVGLLAPHNVDEDQDFTISANMTVDDNTPFSDLLFFFTLDGVMLVNWTSDPVHNMSIGTSGNHFISAFVKDRYSDIGEHSHEIFVRNVEPTGHLTGPSEGKEDQTLLICANITDTPSDAGTLELTWYLDGEELEDDGYEAEVSIPDSGLHMVTLVVEDDDGAEMRADHSISIENVPPQAEVGAFSAIFEDDPILLDGSLSTDTDSDRESLNYSWDIDGNGGWDLFGIRPYGSFFPEEGEWTVTLLVTDDDGATSTAHGVVRVVNKIPRPIVEGPLELNEDQHAIFRLGPEPDTPSDVKGLSLGWFLDGEPLSGMLPDGSINISFAKCGTYSLSVEARDDQGAVGSNGIEIEVDNVRPAAVISGVPAEVERGRRFTVSGYMSHDTPSDMSSLVFRWFLDDLPIGDGGENLTLEITDAGVHTLGLEVEDDDGSTSNRTGVTLTVLDGEEERTLFERALTVRTILLMIIAVMVVLAFGAFLSSKVSKLNPPSMEKDDEEERTEGERSDREMGVPEGMDIPAGETEATPPPLPGDHSPPALIGITILPEMEALPEGIDETIEMEPPTIEEYEVAPFTGENAPFENSGEPGLEQPAEGPKDHPGSEPKHTWGATDR